MPELPEVEAVARSLRRLVRGKTIVYCRVLHRIAVRPQSPATLRRGIEGQRIEEVQRRGKYLLLRLTRGWVALHFRLDGRLVWFSQGCRTRGCSPGASPHATGAAHVDVELHLNAGTLGFGDPRHFGRVLWLAHPEHLSGIRTLGVDPLSWSFTPERLQALLGSARRPLKLLLMDQTRIAGLGNIYANEALWHARLDPRRRSDRVDSSEARRLHKAIVYVLRRALECCVHPPPDLGDPGWWFWGLERILRVYGREAKQCRRCASRIRRIAQGGRSSFYCPRCQR